MIDQLCVAVLLRTERIVEFPGFLQLAAKREGGFGGCGAFGEGEREALSSFLAVSVCSAYSWKCLHAFLVLSLAYKDDAPRNGSIASRAPIPLLRSRCSSRYRSQIYRMFCLPNRRAASRAGGTHSRFHPAGGFGSGAPSHWVRPLKGPLP